MRHQGEHAWAFLLVEMSSLSTLNPRPPERMNSTIPTILGRLLAELSWEGSKITSYRQGGRGYENVLTTEVLQALDFLPRTAFLGAILRAAHGGCPLTADRLSTEIEDASILVLPGNMILDGENLPKINVQPDAIIASPSVYFVVEAKRIRSSSFQPLQLAREFLLAHRHAEGRKPQLLLILSSPTPVVVQGKGRMAIHDAIVAGLPRTLSPSADFAYWANLIGETVAWITWREIAAAVRDAVPEASTGVPSVDASIKRIANALLASVEWHGEEK